MRNTLSRLATFCGALVLIGCAASSARADSVCILGGAELTGSGAGPIANNALTITAVQTATGTQFTITGTNLQSGAFISNLLINSGTAAGPVTVVCNNCAAIGDAPVVTVGNNNQTLGAFTGGNVLISFDTSPPADRLTAGETIVFTVQGLFGVDLCELGIAGPMGSGPFSAIAHIQGLGPNNSQSGHYTCTSCTNAPIPEPTTMLLLGTGLAGVAGAVRRRRKDKTA